MLEDTDAASPTRGSALRHRPIMPDAIHIQVQTRRASRLRQKPQPYSPDDLAFESLPKVSAPRRTPKASRTWLIYLVLGMLMAMLLLWLGQMLWNWGQNTLDDLRYGRPRTTHVDHFVGHETGDIKTHFVAMNLGGVCGK